MLLVGSDIIYKEELEHIAKTNKPIFLATGASTIDDVETALNFLEDNQDICLMQCNTNYTGSKDNLHFINLNVLNQYRQKFQESSWGFLIIRTVTQVFLEQLLWEQKRLKNILLMTILE